MPGGHAADTQTPGYFFLGGNGLPRLKLAGANEVEEPLANLVIERDNTLSIEPGQIHFAPHLYRQLGVHIYCVVGGVKRNFQMPRMQTTRASNGERKQKAQTKVCATKTGSGPAIPRACYNLELCEGIIL